MWWCTASHDMLRTIWNHLTFVKTACLTVYIWRHPSSFATWTFSLAFSVHHTKIIICPTWSNYQKLTGIIKHRLKVINNKHCFCSPWLIEACCCQQFTMNRMVHYVKVLATSWHEYIVQSNTRLAAQQTQNSTWKISHLCKTVNISQTTESQVWTFNFDEGTDSISHPFWLLCNAWRKVIKWLAQNNACKLHFSQLSCRVHEWKVDG